MGGKQQGHAGKDVLTIRYNCPVCGSPAFEVEASLNMPTTICSVSKRQKWNHHPMHFVHCLTCGSIYIKDILPLKTIYLSNHNRAPHGRTWSGHVRGFAYFIETESHMRVLEIGGATGNLFFNLIRYPFHVAPAKWDVLDMDCGPTKKHPKLGFIKGIFPQAKVGKYDAVVMSHVFEHFQDPVLCLKKIKAVLCGRKQVFLSFPVYTDESLLYNINFEHSYAIRTDQVVTLFAQHGFEVVRCQKYLNHSMFYEFRLNDVEIDIGRNYSRLCGLVFKLNKRIHAHKGPVYLWGAHLQPQYMRAAGLHTDKVVGILDNNEDKIGKYLYGFDIKTLHPDVLKGQKNPLVVCHMGVYTAEIVEQIKRLNPKAVVI